MAWRYGSCAAEARKDIVVIAVRLLGNDSEYELRDDQVFGAPEKELFTDVVNIAEKEGKPVELLVAPAIDPFDALVQTANQLKVSRLVTGVSRLHDLWLQLSAAEELGCSLHHRDVVGYALRRLEKELGSDRSKAILHELGDQLREIR